MAPASPFWVTYGPLLGICAYAFCFAVVAGLSRRLATFFLQTFKHGAPRDQHWTERNRRRSQEMQVSVILNWTIPLVGLFIIWDSVARRFPGATWVLIGSYFLFRLAVRLGSRHADYETEDPAHRVGWQWPGRTFALVFIFSRNFFLALVGAFLAARMPQHRYVIAAVTAILMVTLHLRAGVWILRMIGVLRKPSPRLVALVAEIATKLQRPAPPCYEVTGLGLNAVAWPTWQVVGVTRASMLLLDDDDIRALLLHEFGHLVEGPQILRLRNLGALLPMVFLLGPLLSSAFPDAGALPYYLSFCAFFLISMRVRRGLAGTEDAADAFAAAAGGTPAAYARALENLYHYNGFPAVVGARTSLHSELYDRLTAVGITPDYARPEPPSRRRIWFAVTSTALVFVVAVTTIKINVDDLVDPKTSSTILALNGWQKYRRGWVYGELAHREADPKRAGELLDEAVTAEPDEPIYLLNRAMMAAQTGDCGRAGARLMQGLTAYERRGNQPRSLAPWLSNLEMYVDKQCGEGIARTDP